MVVACLLAAVSPAHAQGVPVAPALVLTAAPSQASIPAPMGVTADIGPPLNLVVGKSTLLRMAAPIDRLSLGDPLVADVTLISPTELYLLGKTYGSTNVIIWRRNGPTTIVDLTVSADVDGLVAQLRRLMPEEKGVEVAAASDSIVLSGMVSSAVKADFAVQIAEGFIRTIGRGLAMPVMSGGQLQPGQQVAVTAGMAAGGAAVIRPRVINLMRVAEPQQVMLEVKVAEVSKSLLDKLGVGLDMQRRAGNVTYGIISGLLSGGAGNLFGVNSNGNRVQFDAQRKDGVVKILAEPNIVAISGQEASFLAGGKIFIPVAQSSSTGGVAISLAEREFGIGLKFTPTVLDRGLINLKVSPEVSELSQTGSAFSTTNGQTSVLPSITTRRVQTTVQLMDGQSLAIAGLMKNNVTEAISRFPLLGEIPVLGALFRSSEFQTDRTELLFVITPRLIKPLPADFALPTDSFTPPSRTEFFLDGKLEGGGSSDVAADRSRASPVQPSPADARSGGFQIK